LITGVFWSNLVGETRRSHREGRRLTKISLEGWKAHEVPMEQPRQFRLVINLKTAKTLGSRYPQSVLLRADEVIE
jgi:ABC-type uncharacterized transport system substrate-binding protein